jgi:hypothetical protein
MKKQSLLVGCSLIVCVACTNREPSEPVAVTSSQLAVDEAPRKDAPATDAYRRVRDAFAAQTQDTLSFSVFDLDDAVAADQDPLARAASLGVSGTPKKITDGPREVFVTDKHRFVQDLLSGTEFFADRTQFHIGHAVDPSELMTESSYIGRAQEYVQRTFPTLTGHVNLYPYKVWTYMNGRGQGDGPTEAIEAYQIAVCFNTMLDDGTPVIGSGGKVAVHMTPAGDVIAHELTIRTVKSQRATVAGDQLLSPDDALAQVNGKLETRGVNLEHFTLDRAEFGYYRRGRDSTQSVMAPHYAYFFKPKEGVESKKLLEVVPAVKDPTLLAVIEADARDDRLRKEEIRTADGPVDTK